MAYQAKLDSTDFICLSFARKERSGRKTSVIPIFVEELQVFYLLFGQKGPEGSELIEIEALGKRV